MPKAVLPELKNYLEKRLFIKLNGKRAVSGVLRGYDQFLNIVLENTVEEVSDKVRNPIGTVVIRGNSIIMMECVERA